MSDPQGSKATETECEGNSATSSQTPTNDQGPGNREAPGEELPARIEQPSNAYLSKMPAEIILSITEHLGRQSLKSLALTSSRLHHTVSDAFYRSFNYETLHIALDEGDYEMFQRCIDHKAASATAVWGAEHARKHNDNIRFFSFKPIDYLTLAFKEDKMTADQCFNVLQWLVDNDGDLTSPCNDLHLLWIWPEQIRLAKTMKHMSHTFLRAFLTVADRAKLDVTAEIICYLSAKGFNFPRGVPLRDSNPYNRSDEAINEFSPLGITTHSPLAWMMGSAYPPRVLEAFLKQLQSQGATLASPLEECPESFRCDIINASDGPRIIAQDTLLTQFWALAANLYNDLLDPLGWRPVYNGEVGDIWEAKLNLLDMYQGIDDSERRHLLSILAALRKIEAGSQTKGGLAIRHDAKACWRELSNALSNSADETKITKFNGYEPADRVHRFSFKDEPYTVTLGSYGLPVLNY
ncbi:hypothetical protein CEP54_013205 [Fusarium duplospermum]|uniref:F-box domain-containing protein n=1 Tax=Fusarium duplospermum TaxID=1325734 RepID=A0A428P487_9HYPO|nr:hypothetical protein CEP54_013205 [Fusarium duplospermum]